MHWSLVGEDRELGRHVLVGKGVFWLCVCVVRGCPVEIQYLQWKFFVSSLGCPSPGCVFAFLLRKRACGHGFEIVAKVVGWS